MRTRSGYATPLLHDERQKARWKIVQEVNKYKMRSRMPLFTRVPIEDPDHRRLTGRQKMVVTGSWYEPKLFGMKHLQLAVNIARRQGLVDSKTLEKAGFNARGK